jgi:hypothetical protein
MDEAFACPECGCEIRLKGLSPGRLTPCDWCRSMVEVPYIPRADQIKRMRRERATRCKKRNYRAWISVGASLLMLLVGLAAARRAVVTRWRSADADALARVLASSRAAEDSGRLGEALADLEAAVRLAESGNTTAAELDELRDRRARLSRREAEAQLSALEGEPPLAPGQALGRALTLSARLEKDPALRGLESRVTSAVDRLRLRWVEDDDRAAQVAGDASRPVVAIDHAARAYRNAAELEPALRRRWQDCASARARRLIARYGVVIDPVRGQFTLGAGSAYDAALHPVVDPALKEAGYLPPPSANPWSDQWASIAPYRMSVDIAERHEDVYLSSPNRLSRIDSVVRLSHKGRVFWTVQPLARTTVPVPGLPAYQASRAASSSHRSPEFERVLYDNARSNLLERLGVTLHQLPAFQSSGPTSMN